MNRRWSGIALPLHCILDPGAMIQMSGSTGRRQVLRVTATDRSGATAAIEIPFSLSIVRAIAVTPETVIVGPVSPGVTTNSRLTLSVDPALNAQVTGIDLASDNHGTVAIAATLLDAESSTTSELILTITPSGRISKVIQLPLLVNLSGESAPRTAHVQLAVVCR